MGQRIEYIDVMKGMAILLVVIGHYLLWTPWIPTIIWSFHMPLFVFLNGFFFTPNEPTRIIKKGFKVYMAPYFIVWFCLVFIDTTASVVSDNTAWGGVKRIISGLYGLASNNTLNRPSFVEKIGAIWFLRALFVGNIMMSVVIRYFNKKWIQVTLIFVSLLVAVWQTSVYCSPLRLNYGCGFLIWLYLGYIFNLNYKQASDFIEGRMGIILCFVFWVLTVILEGKYGIYSIPSVSFPLYGFEIVGGFCGIMIIMTLSKYIIGHIDWLRGLFSYLGRISLWVLCVHSVSLEITSYLQINCDTVLISLIRIVCDVCIAVLLKELVSCISLREKTV